MPSLYGATAVVHLELRQQQCKKTARLVQGLQAQTKWHLKHWRWHSETTHKSKLRYASVFISARTHLGLLPPVKLQYKPWNLRLKGKKPKRPGLLAVVLKKYRINKQKSNAKGSCIVGTRDVAQASLCRLPRKSLGFSVQFFGDQCGSIVHLPHTARCNAWTKMNPYIYILAQYACGLTYQSMCVCACVWTITIDIKLVPGFLLNFEADYDAGGCRECQRRRLWGSVISIWDAGSTYLPFNIYCHGVGLNQEPLSRFLHGFHTNSGFAAQQFLLPWCILLRRLAAQSL